MPWSRLQSARASQVGGTSITVPLSATTDKSLLVFMFVIQNPPTSIKTNTGLDLTLGITLTSSVTVGIYYLINAPVGITGITIIMPFSTASAIGIEYSSSGALQVVDKSSSHDNGFQAGGVNWTSNATATLIALNELVVGSNAEIRKGGQTFTAGGSFTGVITTTDGELFAEDILNYNSTTGIAASGTISDISTTWQNLSLVLTFNSGVPPGTSVVVRHPI